VSRRSVLAPGLSRPQGHFAHVTVADPGGRLVFVSGMSARDEDGTVVGVGDIAVQSERVWANLALALAAVGATLDDVARVDVFVRHMTDFDVIQCVRRRHFRHDPPASTMVEVTALADPDMLLEVSAIAVVHDEPAGRPDS
jgi:enamine deaminase RidA (YjgF/YER057c/UK114 family)